MRIFDNIFSLEKNINDHFNFRYCESLRCRFADKNTDQSRDNPLVDPAEKSFSSWVYNCVSTHPFCKHCLSHQCSHISETCWTCTLLYTGFHQQDVPCNSCWSRNNSLTILRTTKFCFPGIIHSSVEEKLRGLLVLFLLEQWTIERWNSHIQGTCLRCG